MLRTVTKFPLSRLVTSSSLAAARPVLSVAATRICESFSTKATPKTKAAPKKKNDVAVKRSSMPATAAWDPFFRSYGFDDVFTRDPFFAPFFKENSPFEKLRREMMMPVLRSHQLPSVSQLVRASPGYEIKETDGAYEIVMEIPKGLGSKDLKVELERDGTVVHVSGEHHVKEEGAESIMHFSKRFSIGEGVDVDHLKANFSDDCLVIQAPKAEQVEPPKRSIPITTEPHKAITDEEVVQSQYNDAFDESDFMEEGKKQVA
jgi:HSP20 family molecular chaperone IbpA